MNITQTTIPEVHMSMTDTRDTLSRKITVGCAKRSDETVVSGETRNTGKRWSGASVIAKVGIASAALTGCDDNDEDGDGGSDPYSVEVVAPPNTQVNVTYKRDEIGFEPVAALVIVIIFLVAARGALNGA